MKHFILLTLLLIASFAKPVSLFAQQNPNLPTISIINEIRGPDLGLQNADLLQSLQGQWEPTKQASISATWLWQYSALENQQLTDFAKQQMANQEFGIFFEIDKNTAEKSGVEYKGKSAWYHSDGLLLISYDLYERHRIIDTNFEKFKQTFGYYPKSVGAWWVGAEPIQYMQKKYNITAVLQCADQFNTDAYSIWGTPWSIPYRPAEKNAAIPAADIAQASQTVIMQWAPRDPLRAYGPGVLDSTFSMQDYELKGYDIRYFNYLINTFLKQSNDQIVFGLEGGLPADSYQGQYKKQLIASKELEQQSKIQIQTSQQYAEQLLKSQNVFPPTSSFLTKDYETNDQSFWFHSAKYRVSIIRKGDKVTLVDLRDYANTAEEDFNIVPNIQKLLRINTEAIIDSVRFPQSKIEIGTFSSELSTEQQGATVLLKSGSETVVQLTTDSLVIPKLNKTFQFQKTLNQSLQTKLFQIQINVRLYIDDLQHNLQKSIDDAKLSKKKIAILISEAAIVIGLFLLPLFLLFSRAISLSIITIAVYLALFFFFNYSKLTQIPGIFATNYEQQALKFLQTTTSQIIYLAPDENLNYKAVQPLFSAKQYIAEQASGHKWEIKKHDYNNQIEINCNSVIIVPRYLGQEIYSSEMEKYKLRKVFDNAQIEIYKTE